MKEQWVIPPEANAEFVCAMEDTLEVYQRPYDENRPLVCFDEGTKQLVKDVREPIPAAPGRLERLDYEYERNGTGNLFMMFEPLAGQREVLVTARRTAVKMPNRDGFVPDSRPDVGPAASQPKR